MAPKKQAKTKKDDELPGKIRSVPTSQEEGTADDNSSNLKPTRKLKKQLSVEEAVESLKITDEPTITTKGAKVRVPEKSSLSTHGPQPEHSYHTRSKSRRGDSKNDDPPNKTDVKSKKNKESEPDPKKLAGTEDKGKLLPKGKKKDEKDKDTRKGDKPNEKPAPKKKGNGNSKAPKNIETEQKQDKGKRTNRKDTNAPEESEKKKEESDAEDGDTLDESDQDSANSQADSSNVSEDEGNSDMMEMNDSGDSSLNDNLFT